MKRYILLRFLKFLLEKFDIESIDPVKPFSEAIKKKCLEEKENG